MEEASTKSSLRGILGALLAFLVFVVVWLLLSAMYGLIGMVRGEGEWWSIFMQDALAPGVAAYVAFEVVDRLVHSLHWRVAFGIFIVAIALLTTLNLVFTSEFYLSQDRVSDWHITIIATILNAVSATIGALVSCYSHWST